MTNYDLIAFRVIIRINIMHVAALLHKTFEEQLPEVHKIRLNSLMVCCEAATTINTLHLTGLGRAISNKNKECSNIQKVERLLGNGHLQTEKNLFYKLMLSHFIKDDMNPWIHIDWTCINSTTNLYALRASTSMKGRSIVVYEECHPKKNENNHSIHKAFLNQLKLLLPSSVTPIIVTDGGFRGPWFAYILTLNWHFVGRLRNKNLVSLDEGATWTLSGDYFEKATGKPTLLGQGLLTKKGKVPMHLVLYKGKSKGRHQLNKNKMKSQSGKSKIYSKANDEPWVLATSLQQAKERPEHIINIFRQRMRIEENIRDTKSTRYGLGLKDSLTRTAQRMNILLLIAAISSFLAWLSGFLTKMRGKAADFQAQSAKFTSALSIIFLGRRAIKKGISMNQEEFETALNLVYQCAIQTQQEIHHYD